MPLPCTQSSSVASGYFPVLAVTAAPAHWVIMSSHGDPTSVRTPLWLITWQVSDHCNVGFLRNIVSFLLRMTIAWRTSIALRLTFKFFNLDAKIYWSFVRWKYWSLGLFPCAWKPQFTDFLWQYNLCCHRSSRSLLSNSTVGCHIV